MPWMLPKDLKMHGLDKAYNKRSAYPTLDPGLDIKHYEYCRQSEKILTDTKQLVSNQLEISVQDSLEN